MGQGGVVDLRGPCCSTSLSIFWPISSRCSRARFLASGGGEDEPSEEDDEADSCRSDGSFLGPRTMVLSRLMYSRWRLRRMVEIANGDVAPTAARPAR